LLAKRKQRLVSARKQRLVFARKQRLVASSKGLGPKAGEKLKSSFLHGLQKLRVQRTPLKPPGLLLPWTTLRPGAYEHQRQLQEQHRRLLHVRPYLLEKVDAALQPGQHEPPMDRTISADQVARHGEQEDVQQMLVVVQHASKVAPLALHAGQTQPQATNVENLRHAERTWSWCRLFAVQAPPAACQTSRASLRALAVQIFPVPQGLQLHLEALVRA